MVLLFTAGDCCCQLTVPQHRLSTCKKLSRRAFSIVGPMTFYALSDPLHDPALQLTRQL